jgi:hypothetical protein
VVSKRRGFGKLRVKHVVSHRLQTSRAARGAEAADMW